MIEAYKKAYNSCEIDEQATWKINDILTEDYLTPANIHSMMYKER